MKVLIIGGGGREHALSQAISNSPLLTELLVCPGNPGISKFAKCIDIDINDINKIFTEIKNLKPDLVVIGPEAPLVNGIVDKLERINIRCFGPNSNAAKLEGSKIFARKFCDRNKIAQPRWNHFSEIEKATEYAKTLGGYCVVKANGLAAGKGVFICKNFNEASVAISKILKNEIGIKETHILVEERLLGPEMSVFAVINGEKVFWLASAQDFKRIFEKDEGENTGGMGAISPSPYENQNLKKKILNDILIPVAESMKKEGNPYNGILYAGLMLTKSGPKLIEFNCRFGDPEAQAILPRMQTDILSLIFSSLNEKKLPALKWRHKFSVTVVLASKGYPKKYIKNTKIDFIPNTDDFPYSILFHSGTSFNYKKEIIASGGRVFSVTGFGNDINSARINSYKLVNCIKWSNGYFRNDIAKDFVS